MSLWLPASRNFPVRVFARLVGMALLFASASCDSAKEKAGVHAQTAQLMLEAGNLPEAHREILEAIQGRDDSADYYLLKGQIELGLSLFSDAFQSFKSALALDQTNEGALSYVANLGLRIGRVADSKEAAQQLLELNPQSLAALQVLGMIALEQQNLDEASGYADKILAISDTDEGGVAIRARVLALQDKDAEALEVLNKSLISIGETPVLLSNLLNIYRKIGDAENMDETFSKIAVKSPDDVASILDHANLLYKTGKKDRARALALEVLKKPRPDNDAYQSVMALWAEYDPQVLDGPARAELIGEGQPMAIQVAMHHLLLMEQIALLKKMIPEVPQLVQQAVWPLSGRVLLRAGETAQARAVAAAVLKEDPDNVDGLLLSAEIALLDRQYAKAVTQAQLAQREDPSNPDCVLVLFRALLAKGATVLARNTIEQGVKNDPQNQYLVVNYMKYLDRVNDTARAHAIARDFVTAAPGSVRGWERLMKTCQSSDTACQSEAQKGRANALKQYAIDDPPGTLPNRSIFGRL